MEQLDLSDFFMTKAQANDFSIRLSAISENIYKTNFDLEKALMEQFGIKKKDKFIAYLRNNKVDLASTSALKETLAKIQETISTLSVISLTIAIEPNEQIIKAISNWFSLNIDSQVLFDIQVDSNIVAGCTMTYNGKCLTFSVKHILDEVMQETLTNSSSKKIM
jgi:F0F1-type ATP synthase delta subunit